MRRMKVRRFGVLVNNTVWPKGHLTYSSGLYSFYLMCLQITTNTTISEELDESLADATNPHNATPGRRAGAIILGDHEYGNS